MRKFFAVVKREYLQRVRSRMFVFMTVFAPLLLSFFGIVPALIFKIPVGPAKIAVVDASRKLYPHLYKAINSETSPVPKLDDVKNPSLNEAVDVGGTSSKTVELEEIQIGDRELADVRDELNNRTRAKEFHGYLVIPANILDGGRPELVVANAGDVFTRRTLSESLNRAVHELRLEEARIDASTIKQLSEPVELQSVSADTAGGRDSGERFMVVFAAGFIMYITILLYGQVVLGAIIEEKETRIAEILFSSVRPFTLMIGKLVGVSFVALTQLAIWGIAFGAFLLYGVNLLASRGMPMHMPNIPATQYFFFALFFLLGYYIYSTIYALVGSMVTTPQEGGQLAMPIVLVLVVGFYLFLPVSRSPDSSFAFWISMVPFFAPVTMMVRIATQTPPFWQIALSLLIGVLTILCLVWIASRIYRIGMLMYGKKATLGEVIRWVRQP